MRCDYIGLPWGSGLRQASQLTLTSKKNQQRTFKGVFELSSLSAHQSLASTIEPNNVCNRDEWRVRAHCSLLLERRRLVPTNDDGANKMQKLSRTIEQYCLENGIEVPAGFYRRSASRYAFVVQESEENSWKLVARTWFKAADVMYYLDNMKGGKPYRVFDFKEMRSLVRSGKTLKPQNSIELR